MIDYIKGFLEILNIQSPRYCFVIEKLDTIYHNFSLKTKICYVPLGCYRPYINYASELTNEIICRKFKPAHAKMIIGISVLEESLDFTKEDQTKIYLNYVKNCMVKLKKDE